MNNNLAKTLWHLDNTTPWLPGKRLYGGLKWASDEVAGDVVLQVDIMIMEMMG